MMEASRTYIRNLRAVSASSRDELALRLRLERTLAHANFHPSWLPPTAILCVRKLGGAATTRAGAPLALSTRRGASVDWERAVAAELDTLARRAARPARETVAANAEAVLFNDQAELLACLAVDWCGGGGVETMRWWWRSLFKGRGASDALIPAWLASPEHVPAALEHLSNAGRLSAFARALNERQARDIRQRVTHKFSLRALEEALEQTASSGDAPPLRVHDEHDGGRTHERETPQHAARPPWEQFVPWIRGAALGDEQSCLIGTSLMLLRAPSIVRSASFAGVVARWRTGSPLRAESGASSSPAEVTPARTNNLNDDEQGERRGSDKAHHRGLSGVSEAHQRTINDLPKATVAASGVLPGITVSAASDTNAQSEARDDFANSVEPQRAMHITPRRPEFSTFVSADERAPDARAETPASASSVWTAAGRENETQTFTGSRNYEARIRTEFGGVFYLLNLGLFLNLYGDFTTPRAPGIDLVVWDFLALVGVELGGERLRRDPVWKLLANLSGRDATDTPGADFTPPESWRVPPEWLAAFPAPRRAWKWKAEAGRLCVLHPGGFLILDVPLTGGGDARAQLELEVAAYQDHFHGLLRRAAFDTASESTGTVEGWLKRLLPYVRARLCRALGVRASKSLGRLVCQQQAQVNVTATHLQVRFALARLPLAVRLAGLDRDPGWMPAAGRNIAFHYD